MNAPTSSAPDALQTFAVDRFQPADAAGVVALFHAVYGDAYPIKHYYDADWLTQANARNEVVSVVARTPSGSIISHMAAYRSAAVSPKLYEWGLGLTLAQYRAQQASSKLAVYLIQILPELGLDGIYGEAVCNHTGMQKITELVNVANTALEVDVMPAEAYAAEKSAKGRVSCLFSVIAQTQTPQTLFLPAPYLDYARQILAELPFARTLLTASATPSAAASDVQTAVFDFAQVIRCQVTACGPDIETSLSAMEQLAEVKQCTTRQVFLNLADPGVDAAAQWLRQRGYSFAGLIPLWFGSDGLLLQKMMHAPCFDDIKLHSPKAKELLTLVRQDWQAVQQGV